MKKLSIITVCLNEENGIEKTIESVQSQTYDNYEHIIIDGGSADKTLEIINKFKDKVDILVSEKDNGIYDAMNKGINLASGEYLYFLNAGDYLVSPNVLKYIFDRKPQTDIVYGDGMLILSNKYLIRKPSPKKISKIFMLIDIIPHQGSLIKKELLKKAGLYDLNYRISGDYEFYLKALYQYDAKCQYIPIPFAVNNLEGVSNQNNFNKIKLLERKKAQDKYLNLLVLRIFKFPLYYFYKYPKYIYYILHSLLSKKYLKIHF